MPIVHVSTDSFPVNDSTVVIDKPTLAAVGDYLIMGVASQGNRSQGAPDANVVAIPGITNPITSGTGSSNVDLILYAHEVTALSPSSFSFPNSTLHRQTGFVTCLRGVELTAPVADASFSSNSLTAPSVDTTLADSLLLYVGTVWVSGYPHTFTAPAGMTERLDQGNANVWTTVATGSQAAIGASGTKAATPDPALVTVPVSALIALTPAPELGNVQSWDGAAWVGPTVKQVWNGTAWIE